MRTEITLRNASETLVEHAVHKTSQTSVPVSVDYSHLAVVVARHVEIFPVNVCGKETASHSVYIHTVDPGKIAVLIPGKNSHALVLNGIQESFILGNRGMGSVADFHLAAFDQLPVLHIYIVYLNTLAASVGIGTHISYIFFIPHR